MIVEKGLERGLHRPFLRGGLRSEGGNGSGDGRVPPSGIDGSRGGVVVLVLPADEHRSVVGAALYGARVDARTHRVAVRVEPFAVRGARSPVLRFHFGGVRVVADTHSVRAVVFQRFWGQPFARSLARR